MCCLLLNCIYSWESAVCCWWWWYKFLFICTLYIRSSLGALKGVHNITIVIIIYHNVPHLLVYTGSGASAFECAVCPTSCMSFSYRIITIIKIIIWLYFKIYIIQSHNKIRDISRIENEQFGIRRAVRYEEQPNFWNIIINSVC